MMLKNDSREILIFAVYIILSVFLVGGSILYIESRKNGTMQKEEIRPQYAAEENTDDRENVLSNAEIVELPENYIRIPKKGNNASLNLKNCYMEKGFDVTISGWQKDELTEHDIARISGTNLYYGDYVKDGRDFVKKLNIEDNQKESPDLGIISLSFVLNHVYEPEILEDEKYFYISVRRPRQMYERIIVIDAGHGGSSSGTYSSSSHMFEKDVNLDVTLKLKELLDKLENEDKSLKVYYTRLTDDNIYLSPRVRLANDVEADAFVSIHCNGNYDTSLYGAELMCAPTTGKHSPYSIELGKFCYESLLKMTGRYDRERYVLDDIYILKHSRVPACILEIGYLTHDKDRQYLENENNRTKAAVGIFNGLTEYLEWLDEEEKP